jgi:hypothetical protein
MVKLASNHLKNGLCPIPARILVEGSYREYKEWLGGYYDANAFDLAEVNERLADARLWQ